MAKELHCECGSVLEEQRGYVIHSAPSISYEGPVTDFYCSDCDTHYVRLGNGTLVSGTNLSHGAQQLRLPLRAPLPRRNGQS